MMSVDCSEEEPVQVFSTGPQANNMECISEEPHDINCLKRCCQRKWLIDRSKETLAYYEELTRPEKLANEEYPLSAAFTLTNEIKEKENNGWEAQQEWRALVRKCKKFTVDLLDECENGREVTALFSIEEEDLVDWMVNQENDESKVSHFVKTFHEAVAAHHFEFVAHRYSQQLLDTIIHSSVRGRPEFLKTCSVISLAFYVVYTLFFPIWVAIFFLCPQCYISSMMKTPFFKFVSHVSQFCVFICFLIWSVLRNEISVSGPSIPDMVIMIFVLTMTGQELLRLFMKEKLSEYFQKWWNWILASMLVLFLFGALFFLVALVVNAGQFSMGTLKFDERDSRDLLLLSNSCFSIAGVISIFYLGALCQANSVFGPLMLSTLRMIQEILKFLTMFLGVFFAFTLGIKNLYSYEPGQITHHNGTVHIHHKLGSFWNATETMFWALFGQTELYQFEETEEGVDHLVIIGETGKFLFGLFLIVAVLVGINMLVAMMNNSFEFVTQDENSKDWKLSRTSLWLEYIGKSNYYLPAPYNVIHLLYPAYGYCKRKYRKQINLHKQREDERRQVVYNITRRYLQHSKQNTQLQELEETQAKQLQSLKDTYSQRKGKYTNCIYESNV